MPRTRSRGAHAAAHRAPRTAPRQAGAAGAGGRGGQGGPGPGTRTDRSGEAGWHDCREPRCGKLAAVVVVRRRHQLRPGPGRHAVGRADRADVPAGLGERAVQDRGRADHRRAGRRSPTPCTAPTGSSTRPTWSSRWPGITQHGDVGHGRVPAPRSTSAAAA